MTSPVFCLVLIFIQATASTSFWRLRAHNPSMSEIFGDAF